MKKLAGLAFWVVIIAIAWQAVTKDPQGAQAAVGDVGRVVAKLIGLLFHR